MISPPRRDDFYPGHLPPVAVQFARLPLAVRAVAIAGPLVIIAAVLAVDVPAGVTVAVLLLGAAAASVVYVKNRSDRHNAAVDRGEIRVLPDPHFRPVAADDLPPGLLVGVDDLDRQPGQVGRVARFDDGWIIRRRNPRDVAVVVGDDGGWARFDPRVVTDLWAVGEYRAGRGRDG